MMEPAMVLMQMLMLATVLHLELMHVAA